MADTILPFNVTAGISASGIVITMNGISGSVGGWVNAPGYTSSINTFNDSTSGGSKSIYYTSPMYKSQANYGSYTVKANRTYFTLFNTNAPLLVKTIRLITVNTVTTGTCYLSIYSANIGTGLPSTLLYNSASLTVSSGYGGASVTNSGGLVTVPAGYFYLAATFSTTPIVFGYYRYTLDGIFGASSYSGGPFNMMPIADYSGYTLGSLPASGVTLSYLENSAGNYVGPVLEFAI